jgi:hypothetical protein
VFELYQNYFIQSGMTPYVQVLFTTWQMHTEKQTYKSKVMITVEMTYKYITDFMMAYAKFLELCLNTLTGIDQ